MGVGCSLTSDFPHTNSSPPVPTLSVYLQDRGGLTSHESINSLLSSTCSSSNVHQMFLCNLWLYWSERENPQNFYKSTDFFVFIKGRISRICGLLFVNTTFKVRPSSPAQSFWWPHLVPGRYVFIASRPSHPALLLAVKTFTLEDPLEKFALPLWNLRFI